MMAVIAAAVSFQILQIPEVEEFLGKSFFDYPQLKLPRNRWGYLPGKRIKLGGGWREHLVFYVYSQNNRSILRALPLLLKKE